MKNAFVILSIFIISCSETVSNKTYSYTEEQNLFLESIGWAGFEPSFIKTTSLTKNLHVIQIKESSILNLPTNNIFVYHL